jgi:hypothetical protein
MMIMYRKNGRCSKCGSKDRRYGEYTRGWNGLCEQAAGDTGYYCVSCKHIDFRTPDFEAWLNKMPLWVVRDRGDKWRKKPS